MCLNEEVVCHAFFCFKDVDTAWFVFLQRYVQTKNIPNERQRDMNNGLVVSPNASDLQGTEMLSSMLAAAAPQQQKQILGEHLFPLVEKRKVMFGSLLLLVHLFLGLIFDAWISCCSLYILRT